MVKDRSYGRDNHITLRDREHDKIKATKKTKESALQHATPPKKKDNILTSM